MRCPACPGTLQPRRVHETIDVHVCDACTGTLVPVNRLVPLLEAIASPLRHAVSTDEPIEEIPANAERRGCPRCRARMTSFGYLGTTLVTADRCESCALIWTDPDELGTMALLLLRTHRRTAERDRFHKEMFEGMARRTGLALRARAVANRIAAGLLGGGYRVR